MLTENFVELMYLRLNRHLSTSDYIAWANTQLEQGCDLPEIAEMASFAFEREPDAQAVEHYFLLCVKQLGLSVPEDDYQSTRDYWSQTCDQMLDGGLTLDEGIAKLQDIDDDQNYYLMQPWWDLSNYYIALNGQDDRWQIVAEDIARLGQDAYTRMLVRQFAALCRLDQSTLPKRFPDVWHCIACGADHHHATDTAQRAAHCPACGAPDTLKNMRYLENRQHML